MAAGFSLVFLRSRYSLPLYSKIEQVKKTGEPTVGVPCIKISFALGLSDARASMKVCKENVGIWVNFKTVLFRTQ